MPGIRADRLLASTAVVFLLSAAGGGAFADPSTAAGVNAAIATPVVAAPTAATPSDRQPSPLLRRIFTRDIKPRCNAKIGRLRRRKCEPCSRGRGGADFDPR